MKNKMSSNNINKAIIIPLISIIIVILSTMILSGGVANIAFADSSEAFSVDDYTDSDSFLIDTAKSIQSFANEMTDRDSTINNTELLQIVPEQYLRFQADG